MVAEHDDRALARVLLDDLENPDRVGAVADQVAEKRIALRTEGLGVREARGQRLEVAVDVREER
jgi:hypothetical protein